ncbi:MAG: hypothetical protein LBD45_01760, partial [Bacteroidales bacterium]|nr:hypothetical protein [Bacteroidales bacterium]
MHKKILFLSVIIAFSCTKNQHFDQFGISFSYPNDWTVTDAEKLGDDYLISVDKNGESIVD